MLESPSNQIAEKGDLNKKNKNYREYNSGINAKLSQ